MAFIDRYGSLSGVRLPGRLVQRVVPEGGMDRRAQADRLPEVRCDTGWDRNGLTTLGEPGTVDCLWGTAELPAIVEPVFYDDRVDSCTPQPPGGYARGQRQFEHLSPGSRSTRSRISAHVPSTLVPSGSAPHPRLPTRCHVSESGCWMASILLVRMASLKEGLVLPDRRAPIRLICRYWTYRTAGSDPTGAPIDRGTDRPG